MIAPLEIREVGKIEEVKQGIIKISGLPTCRYGEVIEIANTKKGMVIEFDPTYAFGIVFSHEQDLKVGDTVSSYGKTLSVPVGDGFLGRIVDSLGLPLDGKGPISPSDFYSVFQEAAGVIDRQPISDPLLTGIKTIDMLIPLGKGQRELIVGDRQIGKSNIALDTIINQKGKGVICIYCWIGGNQSAFTKLMQLLQQKGAFDYLVAVAAPAEIASAAQYLCPYTAAAMGEYFMRQGKDVLVVFDDLTKHAWVYRQMSLLLERTPGREAYPGDIFFLHSQLMERAGRLKQEAGGGTMTFLPLAETLQGDITGYICSNLVSMTDGQIYLNTALFQEGFKPAIDLELSVSRIGSRVQYPAIRALSTGLRYEYVQYRSLLRLTRLRIKFSSEATQQLHRGKVLYELLIQENGSPVSLAEEIVLLYSFQKRILEALDIEQVRKFKTEFFGFLKTHHHDIVTELEKSGEITEQVTARIEEAIASYFRGIEIGTGR